MRKKNDSVKVPLAIPKSCDFFFGQINVGCQATHIHTHTERKREGSIVKI